jgi:fructose-specific phosphotransferase system IIA component
MQSHFIREYHHMQLSDNLKKKNILIKTSAKSRWELISDMVNLAVKNNEIAAEHKETIKKALVDREKSMSTGIGNGVAIPHCTTTQVDDIVIIIVINQNGIDFDSIDNLPVKIIILLLVPKNKLTQHIKTLANIAKMMSDENMRNRILSAKTPDKVLMEIEQYDKTKNT